MNKVQSSKSGSGLFSIQTSGLNSESNSDLALAPDNQLGSDLDLRSELDVQFRPGEFRPGPED